VSDMFAMTIVIVLVDSGNLEGKSPYMTGDSSCSNCLDDKKRCVDNLCSKNESKMLH